MVRPTDHHTRNVRTTCSSSSVPHFIQLPLVSSSPLDGCWYAVATSAAIGDQPHPIEVRDQAYVLWRGSNGTLIAAADRCTHREAKLSLGTVTDGCLHCPYHGWSFGDQGRCVGVPSSGPAATIAPAAHLTPLAVTERYGLVWFSVRSTMSYENGIEQTLFMTASPISAERSYFTFVLWRNDDVSTTGQQIVDFEREVAREDRQMLEQFPGELSLDRGALVDVQSDKASLEWRRRYSALINPAS